MAYSGNHPRFSAQNFDAKEAYNKDLTASARLHYLENDEHDKGSPAHQNQESSGSAVYMTTPKSYRTSMSKHWEASNPSFDDPIAHDEAGRAGEGSPAMNYDTSKGSHSHPHDSPNNMISPLNKEAKRVKIETEGSTEYVRGGREEDKNGRSVEVSKDFAGDNRKTVRRKKKDGSIKTTSRKISDKRAAKIKKRKDKSTPPSPIEMHKGEKHDPDTKNKSMMRDERSTSKRKSSKLEKDNEKETTRLNEKVNSRRKKESSEKASDAMMARLKAKRDKDRENKSKEQSQKEMEALSKRKRSEKENSSTTQSTKTSGNKQRERRAAEVKSGERDEMGYQTSKNIKEDKS